MLTAFQLALDVLACSAFSTLEKQLIYDCHKEGGLCLQQDSRLAQHHQGLEHSAHSDEVTVVLNHWQRPAENLLGQLRAASAGPSTEVWICIFGSSFEDEYQAILAKLTENATKVKLIRSDVDFGVYGRFFLASFVKTKYVYIVDDDVTFPVSAIEFYLKQMRKQQGIWGHVGHLHSSNPDLARWINRPKKPTVVDYANAAWFLEASWISRAFLREPPPSKLTGEDLHLSYMVRKVLGLETRVVGWRRDKHPFSRYRLQMTDKTTLTPPMFSLRSFLLRAEMSRGPAVRHEPIQCLAYVDTPLQARHLLKLRREGVELCSSCSRDLKVALLLSGLQDDIEVQEIEEVGRILCHESFGPCFVPYEVCGEVCQNMGFAKVTSLNMRVGPSGTRPFLAADLLEAAGSVLLALHVRLLVLPAEESWMRPDPVLKELQEGSIVTDVLGTVGSDWASKPRLATTTLAKVPWWKAIAVLEGMVTLQMRINEFHCNVVLKASPWRQQGAHLMSMANAQLEQDQVTLTSGIAKGEAPWPVAVRRLHEMNNHHIRCDVTGFSALLTACDKQRWTKAFEFLHHMALQKLLPDVVTITAGIVAAGSLMSWPLSLKLCQMRPKEVLLNAFVLTSVLKACDPPGQWGLALLHLQHAFAQRAPPTSACNAAAGLLSRVGLWHWVLTVALTRPDNLSWPIAVNACLLPAWLSREIA
ncbi:Uncharacterized protein SCF082_LOCUS39011 [Durusdinium trenchii]|uniref:Uncharacterized protein n=1 Tax=Durusdinium trenchii TaxID=1381693 RepID=A0ABP0Q1A9_9DINO